jgi:hypothetical protein
MKYLQPKFAIAVSSPRTERDKLFDVMEHIDYLHRRERAKKHHEYENGGVMCGLCGLDQRAQIHLGD